MHRSPLYFAVTRAAEGDGGGAADLQTDIMRFMAILALCLVAVFALVQSIPLAPVTPKAPAAQPATPTPEQPAAPAPEQPAKSAPEQPAREPAGTAATPPAARPVDRPAPEPTPAIQETAPPAADGFMLRFESDSALTRLVARQEVGVYALVGDRALRMTARQGRLSFWPASVPNRFHEMDQQTVPADVVRSLRRSGAVAADAAIQWGVTLPATMSQQLDRYLAEQTGGTLVIAGNGSLRLEP